MIYVWQRRAPDLRNDWVTWQRERTRINATFSANFGAAIFASLISRCTSSRAGRSATTSADSAA
jgi:hypothetical protein